MTTTLFDPKIPVSLRAIQEWFGPIISRPLAPSNKIEPMTPSNAPIQEEACRYVTPSPTLKPHERMEIYNKQYWWRLLKMMEKDTPLLARLFGQHAFQQEIAIPYLAACPPHTWSLNALLDRFPSWLRDNYHQDDRSLVLDVADVDCAFISLFVAPNVPPIHRETVTSEEAMFCTPFKIAPSVALFVFPYNLFYLRKQMLKEEISYWEENDFPELERDPFYFVLHRNDEGNFSWVSISEAHYHLLASFKEENTLETVEQQPNSLQQEVVENFSEWFEEWILKGWIYIPTT